MLRTLLVIVLVPAGALLAWLALGTHSERAEFTLTSPAPRTIDPQRVSWLREIQLTNTMFEGLTRLNSETFLPEPAVARAWEITANGLIYTFYLRDTARWSDGEPVVAEDFRRAWLRALHPRTEAPYGNLLFTIRGGADYYHSRLNDEPADNVPADLVGIEACDPLTLRVTLAGPCSYFLDLTSFAAFAPVPRGPLAKWAYRDGEVLRSTQHLWTRPGNIVCNGPFVLTRWDFKQRLWMERNPYYWDRAAIGVSSIEVQISNDPNADLIAYQTGRVDMIRWVERSAAEVLIADQHAGRRHDFHTGDRFATFFYRVNCRRPPLDNVDLRKALSLAIDREAICEHVMRLGETPAYTHVPRTTLQLMPRTTADGETIYYEPPAGLGAGLDKDQREDLARAHLRRSGFDGGRPIEIAFPPVDPEQRSIAEAVQAMWEEVLGISVSLKSNEGKVLAARIRNLDYDIGRSNWFGDYMDPSTFLDMFTTDSGQNRTGWSSAEYDRLIAAAAAEPDNRRRYELFQQAERILCEQEVPIIPVLYRRGNYLLSPRFTGINDNARDLLQIHRVRPAN